MRTRKKNSSTFLSSAWGLLIVLSVSVSPYAFASKNVPDHPVSRTCLRAMSGWSQLSTAALFALVLAIDYRARFERPVEHQAAPEANATRKVETVEKEQKGDQVRNEKDGTTVVSDLSAQDAFLVVDNLNEIQNAQKQREAWAHQDAGPPLVLPELAKLKGHVVTSELTIYPVTEGCRICRELAENKGRRCTIRPEWCRFLPVCMKTFLLLRFLNFRIEDCFLKFICLLPVRCFSRLLTF